MRISVVALDGVFDTGLTTVLDALTTANKLGDAYGATLHDGSEYRGNYGLDVAALVAFHRPRLSVLASAGADLLACETLPCLEEAVALARLLPEFPRMQAWISFSCRDGMHVSQGETLAECLDALEDCA
jgi:homocysteine S-methyltransferase